MFLVLWRPQTRFLKSRREGAARHTPSTRMETRTWRSAIADLKGSPPGAPSGALGEGTPGWVWLCDAAISCYLIKQLPWGLLQKTQTRKMPDLAVVARTPFWLFCAGQRRIGPGQTTDGT